MTKQAVMEALDGLPPVKVHCSLLAEEAIHAALWDYAQKKGITIEGLEKPKDKSRKRKKRKTIEQNRSGGHVRGVDSSVAAWLLKKEGTRVIGVTMQIWQDEEPEAMEAEGRLLRS